MIEPRVISGGIVTPWDISADHAGTVIETKLNPTRVGEADNPDRPTQLTTLGNFHRAAAGAILPPRASQERGNFSSLLLNVAGGNVRYFSDKMIRRLLSDDT